MMQFTKNSLLFAALVTLAVSAGTPGVGRADGLIANWTLNMLAPGNTLTGHEIADTSGNGHTATLSGATR